MPDIVNQPDHSKSIIESKFFLLSQTVPILRVLTPDLPVQITAEQAIGEELPRVAEDGDATRIIISYVNLRGKPTVFKLLDDERLDRKFDIDHFVNGFMNAGILAGSQGEDYTTIAERVIILALNMATSVVLGVDNEMRNQPRTSALCHTVVKSITSILFPNALDVMIVVQENPREDRSSETDSIIIAMWPVKLRPEATE